MTFRQFFILFRLRLLGLAVICLLVASGYGGLAKVGACRQAGQMLLKGNFSSVDGINRNSDVFMSGLPIGKVCGMDLITDGSGKGQVQLTLAVDDNLSLADDSGFLIVSYGLGQPKVVNIIPGGSFLNLANGDEIIYTTGSVAVEKLLLLVLQRAEAMAGITIDE